ncbi:hypothetical protein BCR42DRAFT_317059 [Absidia repens]|uniref:Fucosyltransferase n=1 Tax=Absidia repens TaxID=90262 RepID=A0A1X2IZG1_9FUNG|nr:hypothetical protein BCR42DRAFT_317059 [Absidia repens]
MDVANRPLPTDFMRRKSKEAPILWIAKNCQASSGRDKYISELMKYINIDSYGDCLNTKPFPKDKTREQLMADYKFYLAIENANCEDYVTEKLADTLKYSAVPIVDGPASYDGYLPNQRSGIRMDAYPDPRELAKYIQFLDDNDDAYLAYLKYRQDALVKPPTERLDPLFVSLWSDQTAHDYRVSWCSICRHMATTWTSRHSGKKTDLEALEQASPRKDRFLVDKTCMAEGKWTYAADGPPYDSYTWTPSPKDEFAYQVLEQQKDSNSSASSSSSSSSSSETGTAMSTQDWIGMLALTGVSIGVVGFALWMIYKRTSKYRRYTKQDSSQL